MNPGLKTAILAQLAAIKAMVASVEELVAIADGTPAHAPTEHKSVARKPPEDPHYLPDDAEEDLEKQMAELMAEAAAASQKEKFLGELMTGTVQPQPTMRGQ